MKSDSYDNKPIFTVAWDFPPTANGESIVCYKAIKKSKLSFDICTFNTEEQVGKFKYREMLKVYAFQNKPIEWAREVFETFKKLDRENNYQIIHTRTMPPTGHYAGFLIKTFKPKIKWVMYFSDPLWNSPYVSLEIKKGLFKKIKEDLFYRILIFGSFYAWLAIHLCDRIIFNNEYLAKHVLGKSYKRFKKKVRIIPYGFDKEIIKKVGPMERPDNKIIISHIGQVYKARNFNVLIAALIDLKQKHPELYSKILIRQVGYIDQVQRKEIENSIVSDVFEFIPEVSFEESISYMKTSDYLLTIDALFEDINYNIYIPSKIYDYMGVRKPLVAISQKEGPTADIIISTGNILIEHDMNKMYDFLIKAANEWVPMPYYEKYDSYNCERSAKMFDDVFLELL